MTSRIILIGRNAAFPTLSGARSDRPALPDAARPSSSPTGRAALLPRAANPPTARNWANLPRLAPSSSGVQPDAVAAAEQRRPVHTGPGPAASCPTAAGPTWPVVLEAFNLAIALTAFGLAAGLLLVMS